MNIVTIAVVAIIAAIFSQLLKRYNGEISMIISLTTGIVIALVVMMQIAPIIDKIEMLIDKTGIENEYTIILFKCLGICLIADFASSACQDAGENNIAQKVEFSGKIAILIISLPLFETLLSIATTLINT